MCFHVCKSNVALRLTILLQLQFKKQILDHFHHMV